MERIAVGIGLSEPWFCIPGCHSTGWFWIGWPGIDCVWRDGLCVSWIWRCIAGAAVRDLIPSVMLLRNSGSARGRRMLTRISLSFKIPDFIFMAKVMRGRKGFLWIWWSL